jgi:triacylglycerol esterase/lipase EstA (alpha/beta hydrolase family)
MAARFWGSLLLGQLLYVAAVTAVAVRTLSPSAPALVLLAFAAWVSAPLLAVATSFLVGRFTVPPKDRAVGAGELLKASIGEAFALECAALHMVAEPLGQRRHAGVPTAAGPARPVLLIHGILCNGAVWRPLLERLRAHGYAPVRAVNLEPLLADLDTHTVSVVRELEALQRDSNGASVAVIAHSMGGLLARAALRTVGQAAISRIVTIGSPHHGTGVARLFRGRLAYQLRPDSPWLHGLNVGQGPTPAVPLTSIYSLHDNLIVPPRTAMLAGASLHELRGIGHLQLLSAGGSIDRVLAALTGADGGG